MIRKMGKFDVTQRTKDGFFSASELLNQWNNFSDQNKKIIEFERLKNTKEFMEELKEDIKSQSDNYHDAIIDPISKVKGRNTKNGKTKDNVWYNPYLFMKFAMWLNPRFELQVIKFVYDNLIEFRHDAGDNYNGLTSAVQRFRNINYPQMAKGLNYIVFGGHEKGIRQKATEYQLKELTEIQKKLAFAVDMNYIRSFDDLLEEMRRMWHMKWDPKHINFITNVQKA